MTKAEKIDFKKRLYERSLHIIELRIETGATAVREAQAAANNEEKSSAGDKYETSRAMNHLQKDMFGRQLDATKKELETLMKVDCSQLHDTAKPGSVILCKDCFFFIAAGIGKSELDGKQGFVISVSSPLAKLLFNKLKGDVIEFNNKSLLINAVF